LDIKYITTKISIAHELCKGCGYCCSVCPKQIILLSNDYNDNGHHYAIINNPEECLGCKFCAIMCPEIAIKIELAD